MRFQKYLFMYFAVAFLIFLKNQFINSAKVKAANLQICKSAKLQTNIAINADLLHLLNLRNSHEPRYYVVNK